MSMEMDGETRMQRQSGGDYGGAVGSIVGACPNCSTCSVPVAHRLPRQLVKRDTLRSAILEELKAAAVRMEVQQHRHCVARHVGLAVFDRIARIKYGPCGSCKRG